MSNFENFFKQLYSDFHPTINDTRKNRLQTDADKTNSDTHNHPDILNRLITIEEVNSVISSLKTGQASSFNQISNEIIKSLNDENVELLTKLFNYCLDSGTRV